MALIAGGGESGFQDRGKAWRGGRGPWLVGLAAGLGLAAFYVLFARLTAGSWTHVVSLMETDWPYVGGISLGFGVQLGLFAHLKAVRRRHARAGNLVASAGAGTSTATMVVCCLHHLGDVLPVIGLSGAALFLVEYKYWMMGVGIAANVLGILLMARLLRLQAGSACNQA